MSPDLRSNIGNLHEYVRAVSGLPRLGPERKGAFPFVTISRQTGAGGHTLAEALVREMEATGSPLLRGWQILDQELCRKILEDAKLKVTMEELLTEKFVHEIRNYVDQLFKDAASQIAVFHEMARIIRTFATLGKVIVVGRAGSLLTQDLPLGIHVRLVAPKEDRIATMMRQFHLTRQEAERQVREHDQSRARLIQSYFYGRDINDPLLYNLVVNTRMTPVQTIAPLLVEWVRRIAEKAGHPASIA